MSNLPAGSALINATEAGLADLIDDLTARIQAGESIDFSAIVAEHPEYADRLRGLLPTLGAAAVLADAADSLIDVSPYVLDGALGDYRIIREVGRGGMGVVYEAEQISLQRRVALKVLPFAATMDPRQLQRFKNEALAAASLEHPHIVPVYGVGCERSVHFYAMKFIDGRPLTDIIHPPSDAPRSAPTGAETEPVARAATVPAPRDPGRFRRIAEWGIQAAEALEHAHSMGIVHRDVKPGNLLIDGQGKLWVTDFGLAKMGADASLTMTGDLLGTLRYMSPEQALAKHGLVDHRTDVYSLGATLYELLTFKPAVPGDDKQEVLRRIAFEEPTRPQSIDSAIPKDLETVCLKCLEKEPAQRYLAAGELASDLMRWLASEPIKAKPPTLLDRAGKWAGRHKSLLALSTMVAFLAFVGLVIAVVRERQLAEGRASERDRAQSNLRHALAALGDSSQHLLDSMGTRPMQCAPEEIDLAKKLLAHFEEFIQTNSADRELRAEVATAHSSVGSIAAVLHDEKRAADETRKALVSIEELLGERPGDRDLVHRRLRIMRQLAQMLPGESSEAESLYGEAILEWERLQQAGEDHAGMIALSQHQLGLKILARGRPAEAEARFRIAAEIWERELAKPQNHGASSYAFHSGALTYIARVLQQTRRFDEADTMLRRAISLARESVAREPRNPSWRIALRSNLSQLAYVCRERKQPLAEIESLYSECTSINERLAQEYPGFAEYRFELAKSLANWAMVVSKHREFPKSLPIRQRSVNILDILVDEAPTNAAYRAFRDDSLWWYSVDQRAVEREADALATLSRIPESNQYYPGALWWRALILLTAQDPALRNYGEALQLTTLGASQATRSGTTKSAAEWALLLAIAQFRADEAPKAKTTLDSIKDLPPDYDDILLYVRAMVHWRTGEKEEALEFCRTAADQRRKQPRWPLLESFHADALRELGLKESDFDKPENR